VTKTEIVNKIVTLINQSDQIGILDNYRICQYIINKDLTIEDFNCGYTAYYCGERILDTDRLNWSKCEARNKIYGALHEHEQRRKSKALQKLSQVT
jgi:hypothetical protein